MLKYLRDDIKDLLAYEVNEQDVSIKLDANEGFWRSDGLHRYPIDRACALRAKLAGIIDKTPQELLLGNGSSELIELVLKAYLEAGETVVSFSPTFSMYRQFTIIHKGVYRDFPLREMQWLDVDEFLAFIEKVKPKIVILCNPNNPTGTLLPKADILRIVCSVDAMVVLDEAYIEFAHGPSGDDLTRDFQNLIVLRTFSKALGLAGIRLGYMLAREEVIRSIHKIRSPYNLNTLTQKAGLEALEGGWPTDRIKLIKAERERVKQALEASGIKPLPSQANFLFFSAEKHMLDGLSKRGILLRQFSEDLAGYYRLTIGTPKENNAVLKAIKEATHETSKL